MDEAHVVCESNLANMYWSATQQLVHHSVTGCIMRPGDMLGSGTISGPTQSSFGSMLELCWKGTREVTLGTEVRMFLRDGDTVIMKGWTDDKGGRVGFVACALVRFFLHCSLERQSIPLLRCPYLEQSDTQALSSTGIGGRLRPGESALRCKQSRFHKKRLQLISSKKSKRPRSMWNAILWHKSPP